MAAEEKPRSEKQDVASLFAPTVPRQHGAWSILVSGFVLGATAGGSFGGAGWLLLGSVLFGFWARHVAGLALRPSRSGPRRELLLPWLLGYTALSLLGGTLLVITYQRWLLLPLGLALLALTAASLFLERYREDRTAAGELLNILGLSVVIPAAAYSATNVFDTSTVGLWALGFLFFGGSVFHVRYLVRKRRENTGSLAVRLRAGWPAVAYHLAALAAVTGLSAGGFLPPRMPLSLLPGTFKVLATVGRRREGPLNIRHIGYMELAHTGLFLTLALLALRGPRWQ